MGAPLPPSGVYQEERRLVTDCFLISTSAGDEIPLVMVNE